MICTLMTVAGVVTGVVVSRASGASGGGAVVRSILKTAIKGSLQAGKAVQSIAHQAREGISDVTAEVKADIAKNTETVESKAAV